jgi:hypothetical protein
MAEYTEEETEILFSIQSAYCDDPSPESGRTYCKGEDEYTTAMALKKKGLLRYVEKGKHKGTPWAHFGLTDEGFDEAALL